MLKRLFTLYQLVLTNTINDWNLKTVFVYQVSWIRRRDWHILTAGTKVFTKDARFQLLHPGRKAGRLF